MSTANLQENIFLWYTYFVIGEYKYVWYSGLSSRLPSVSVEYPAVLVCFRIPAYSGFVSEPTFSEPDPISVKKYRNGSRNMVFPSVSVRFHRYKCYNY
jgi:hypothetical protein